MNNPKPKNIDEFIAAFPTSTQKLLWEMHAIIRKAAPDAEESISYGIPTFKVGKSRLYFSGYKNHIGFYPGAGPIIAFKDEIAKYKTAKGSVQFPLNKPLPKALISKMVKWRIEQTSDRAKPKSVKNPSRKLVTKYHADGSLWAKGTLINGVMEGSWEWFRKNGTIMRSDHFTKGKQTGEWTTYDKNGKIVKVTNFTKR